jgi:hypothetical protein
MQELKVGYILRIKLNIFESACRTYIKSLTDPRLILAKKIKYESAKNYNQSRIMVKLVRSRRVFPKLTIFQSLGSMLFIYSYDL